MIYCVSSLIHLLYPDSWVWFLSLVSGFQVSTVAACTTAERRALHYIRLLSKPTLMKASWLQHWWQMQGGQPMMLIFVYAMQQVIIKVRERSVTAWVGELRGVQSLGDSLSWFKGSGWLSVVLPLHTQTSMLISPHSCCHTRTEAALPQWFMSCQGRGFAFCLTSKSVPLCHLGHMGPVQMTGCHSSLISFPSIEIHATTH